MNSNNKIRIGVCSVLALNFLTLVWVFLYPRIEYVNSPNAPATERQIRQDAGTFDLPNIFVGSYQVAYQILDRTEPDAVLFLPPESRSGWTRSALLQILYPRRIYFGGNLGSDKLNDLKESKSVYRVVHPDWHPEGCQGISSIRLGTSGARLCRVN